MEIAKVVPMAFVMIAGPQIVSAIMFATSRKPRADSLAFIAGAFGSTVVGASIVFVVASALGARASSSTGADPSLEWLFVLLLAILAVRVFMRRKVTQSPKWMGKLQTASPAFAFRLGALLFIAMPTDAITLFTVGTYLAAHQESLLGAVPFFVATLLLVSLPLLVVIAMGKRARTALPKLRDWMNANSWIVSECVLVFFILMELKAALAG